VANKFAKPKDDIQLLIIVLTFAGVYIKTAFFKTKTTPTNMAHEFLMCTKKTKRPTAIHGLKRPA